MNVKEWLGENNQIGIDIFKNKYQHGDETVEEFADRVSGGNKELAQLILDKKFLFGGRVLANRGIEGGGNYYNCYSDGYVPDSMNGILDTTKTLGITYKSQGGQGISLSKIRPAGTPVGEHYESDGIVPFMRLFNEVTNTVSQGGARKGALMMSLDIRHKEADKFITIKSQDGEIEKANLSLEIDDKFMEAVAEYYETGKRVVLHEKREYSGHTIEYDIVPIDLYKLMMQTVYDWGEPGCIFTNRFRNYNLMEFDEEYNVETCNPCGEQPLKAKTSCNLGSLNLYEFVDHKFELGARFNWEEFEQAIKIAIRGLDDIIDENLDRIPLEEYRQNSINYRNIGLGVMGYADMLMALGYTYGQHKAKQVTNNLFNFMFRIAVETSNQLAKEKGAFPKWNDKVLESNIIKKHFYSTQIEEFKKDGLRNCSLLSIAPTGSIATMLGVSGGIEPEFALSYTRRTDNLGESYDVDAKVVQDYKDSLGLTPYGLGLNLYGKELPQYFITSDMIKWHDRLETQAIIQNHIDTAISSTVNLPKETTLEEIEKLYLEAWKMKLKGVTIFRDGCKRLGILLTEDSKADNDTEAKDIASGDKKSVDKITSDKLERGTIIMVNDDVVGKKRKIMSGCGPTHCTAFFDPVEGNLLEIYLSRGSQGTCSNYMTGLSRMISLAARGGISIDDIIDQLHSCGVCPSYAVRTAKYHDTSKGSCCPVAIGYALKDMYDEMQEELGLIDEKNKPKAKPILYATSSQKENSFVACPECGEPLLFEGGCNICKSCGYSSCS